MRPYQVTNINIMGIQKDKKGEWEKICVFEEIVAQFF